MSKRPLPAENLDALQQVSAKSWEDFTQRIPESQFHACPSVVSACRFTVGGHDSLLEEQSTAVIVLSERCKGQLQVDASGQRLEGAIRPSTLTFMPPHTRQHYAFRGVTTNTALSVDKMLLQRVADSDSRLGQFGQLEPRTPFYRPRLERLIQEQFRIMETGAAGWRVLSEALAIQLAYELLDAFGGSGGRIATAPLEATDIDRLAQFIDAHMHHNFGLSDMAAVLGREPFGFARAFKAATGESPHQFVIHRRLARVRAMLETGKESLAEIAYACGFSSQSHMTATFTRHIGVPPGRYRRSLRE